MDVVDILAGIKKVTEIGQSTRQKQTSVSVSDVWHLWDMLVAKYDTVDIINVLLNFTKDDDLKAIAKGTFEIIETGVKEIEQLMLEYAIPLPQRPPKFEHSTSNLELITDRYIFNRIFDLVKSLMPILAVAISNSTQPAPINFFKEHIISSIELLNNLSIYGEVKGYIDPIPIYMP